MIKLKHLLTEIDDEKIIKYKDKDGKPGEMKAGSAKTMETDHPAKIAWDKMAEKDSKGGDDKKDDSQKVSFDRTAGDDTDSKSDDSADKGQRVVDGKITIGDGDKKEEVDVEAFANTLDLPGIDAKTLAAKFESGDAKMEADENGRVSFSFNDPMLGYISAEIEEDGHFDSDVSDLGDGDGGDADEDEKDALADALRDELDYYHDQFKPEDDDDDDDDDEDMDDEDEEESDDDREKRRLADLKKAGYDSSGRPTKKTEYKGSNEYTFEDSAVEIDGETWDVYKVGKEKDGQFSEEEEDKQRETLPKSYTKGKFANQFGIMHPKEKLKQVASFLKKVQNYENFANISDEDLEYVRNTFSFSNPAKGANVSDNFGAGAKMKNISDERLRIGIMNDLSLYSDGKPMRVMMHIMEPKAEGRAAKKDDGKVKIFNDDGSPTYFGKAFVVSKEKYRKEGDPLPQDEFPSKKEGMIKLKDLLR